MKLTVYVISHMFLLEFLLISMTTVFLYGKPKTSSNKAMITLSTLLLVITYLVRRGM